MNVCGNDSKHLAHGFHLRILTISFLLFLGGVWSQIQCKDVLLEDSDISKAICEYASQSGIEHLVLGSSAKTSLLKYATLFLSHVVILQISL